MWLPKFLSELDRVKGLGRVIVSYGVSNDNTIDVLKKWSKETSLEVEVYLDPVKMKAMSSATIGLLYQDYQKIITDTSSCSHILMPDSDLVKLPKNLVDVLLKHDKDIIAPYPYVYLHDKPCRLFYDSHCYRKSGYRFHPLKPPRNNGQLIQLDSVGTCMLVKRKPFLDTPYSDPYPHMKFCDESRAKGYEVWADPSTVVWHLDVPRLGLESHAQHEILVAAAKGDPNPMSHASMVPYIRDDGSTVTPIEIILDIINAYVYGRV
jgi:hypothetical protein